MTEKRVGTVHGSMTRRRDEKIAREERAHRKRRWIRFATCVTAGIVIWAGGIYYAYYRSDVAYAAHQERLARETTERDALVKMLVERRLAQEAAERKQTTRTITDSLVSQLQAGAASPRLADEIKSLPCNHSRLHVDATKPNVLINKQHCIQPLDYEPSDLTIGYGILLTRPAMDAYRSMAQAAEATGLGFTPTSGYRSYEDQIDIFASWYRHFGNAEQANGASALPGYSEHQLGFAVDLAVGACGLECFKGTAEYAWLREHAHEYGYIERYMSDKISATGYQPESWHWRYVGVELAMDMRKRGIATLEEYYDMPGGAL